MRARAGVRCATHGSATVDELAEQPAADLLPEARALEAPLPNPPRERLDPRDDAIERRLVCAASSRDRSEWHLDPLDILGRAHDAGQRDAPLLRRQQQQLARRERRRDLRERRPSGSRRVVVAVVAPLRRLERDERRRLGLGLGARLGFGQRRRGLDGASARAVHLAHGRRGFVRPRAVAAAEQYRLGRGIERRAAEARVAVVVRQVVLGLPRDAAATLVVAVGGGGDAGNIDEAIVRLAARGLAAAAAAVDIVGVDLVVARDVVARPILLDLPRSRHISSP